MSTAAPTIPPRPVRHQVAEEKGAGHLPDIPPRPIPKRLERSVSPSNYPRSPLNEPYDPIRKVKTSELQIPRRPSVQHLPSVGQEGLEYADIQHTTSETEITSALGADAAAQTRNVGHDLPLHAPKPSLPGAAAKAQVQDVTRTDSATAAAHGFGKPDTPGPEDHEPLGRIRSRASFSRPSSAISAERHMSTHVGDEPGPAEIGLRVPINPLLGDVQAPSPSPQVTPHHTGQNGERRRSGLQHVRTRSGRDGLPPGSYGLHGHGLAPVDAFEKEWYTKHPEELQHEEDAGHGVYESIGSGRGEYALSSDELNRLVRSSSRGGGFGTTGKIVSYPDEQIGYIASEHYASRSTPSLYQTKSHPNTSQPAIESPLRTSSFPAEDVQPGDFRKSHLASTSHDEVLEESENEGPVHVAEPARKYNKVTGGEESINEREEARPYLTRHDDDDDRDYSVPILADDEVAKGESNADLHAAISPKFERRGSQYENEYRSGDHTPTSRPASRPGSIYGLHSASHSLARFQSHLDERDAMHTPLEDVDEYEPLFPEDDDKKRPSIAERFKSRPDALRHRFPSQDIWEDTPSSSMHIATVSTPDLPQETSSTTVPKRTFEHPDAEAKRKEEATEEERKKLIPKDIRLAQSDNAPHLRDDMPTRPGARPRFPSRDIWEDSPDSMYLTASVQTPPPVTEEESDPLEQAKPPVPARPAGKSRLGEGASPAQIAPSVPPRPTKDVHAAPPFGAPLTSPNKEGSSPTELKKVPSIPDRKPQIPPRPAKKVDEDAGTKQPSAGDETDKSAPSVKAKPPVPARPAQSKIGNLQGGFLADLNKKLGLGPPKEKEPQPVEEAKPLEDARKERARGPQRRAPAKSPAAEVKSTSTFSMFRPTSLWSTDDSGLLNVKQTAEELTEKKVVEEKVADEDLERRIAALHVAKQDARDIAPDEGATEVEHTDQGQDLPSRATAEKESFQDTKARAAQMPAMEAPLLSTNTAGEHTDPAYPVPSVTRPAEEKANPLEDEVSLSQHTTHTDSIKSDHTLDREVPDPSTDAIPISKNTTASASESHGEPLERSETKAPDENITIRDEQTSAPAPGPAGPKPAMHASVADATTVTAPSDPEDVKTGADKPREPMNEDDISYAKLEAMTAQADNKVDVSNAPSKLM